MECGENQAVFSKNQRMAHLAVTFCSLSGRIYSPFTYIRATKRTKLK
jgi:hypothetical protein